MGYAAAVSYLLLIFLSVMGTLYARPILAGGSSVSAEATAGAPVLLKSLGADHSPCECGAHPGSPQIAAGHSGAALRRGRCGAGPFSFVSDLLDRGDFAQAPRRLPEQATGLDPARSDRTSLPERDGRKRLTRPHNSLIIAGSAAMMSVLIGSLAAYSLARFTRADATSGSGSSRSG